MTQPINPPTKTNTELAIKEMEIKVLLKFLSSDRQKTQITADQRLIISILDGFALNPYPISQAICKRLEINFNKDEFTIDFLQEFLKYFIEYGIPLDRAGRAEEVKVLEGYFKAQRQDDENDKKNTISTKLMK